MGTECANLYELTTDARAPASNAVKIRLLHYLGKSILATNLVTQMIQIVFDGIYGN